MGHDARLKSHFLKGYMPDIVLVFFANEILSTKVVEIIGTEKPSSLDNITLSSCLISSTILVYFNWLNYHADFLFPAFVCRAGLFSAFEAARG